MNLDVEHWKEFKICNLFDVFTGGDLVMSDLEIGEIPVASNSCQNNSIAGYTSEIENRKLFDHTKSISIADRGKFWAFIQPKDFYIGTRVKALVCKTHLNLSYKQMCFIATIINQESFKFSYGRNCCEKLPNIIIKLPVKHINGIPKIDISYTYSEKGYIPDFEWMESYIESLKYKPLTTINKENLNLAHLNSESWKEFKLSKLFVFENGKKYPSDQREPGVLPLVSTSANNNGVSDYIAPRVDHVYSNFLTVAYSGSVGATFYHENDVFVGETVLALLPTFEMTKYVGLFIATVMNFGNYRYSYGRKIKCSTYGDTTINLPICYEKDSTTPKIDNTYKYSEEGYIPDFEWMEEYIKSLKYKPLTTANKKNIENERDLDVLNWKDFKLSSICNVINGKGITEEEISNNPGNIEAIQGGSSNNGCLGKIDEDYCIDKKYKVIFEPCLTVARVGSAGYINFQSSPVAIGDKAKALILKEHKTKAVYLFVGTLLSQNIYKYSYGRGLKKEMYMEEILKLPICYEEDGVTPKIDNSYKYSEEGYIPDFKWMENYIKSLPYGDSLLN